MQPTRRRFIAIAAAAGGLPLLPFAAAKYASASNPLLRVWSGAALGADATMQIHHPDPARADALIAASLAEVERLETQLSLYRPDSAICRLNRDGVLDDPPFDLIRALSQSRRFGDMTGGAFDVTVQPLWELYARHFSRPDASPSGPSDEELAAVVARIGQDAL
ncbi:MAG TPA: FAD:protein FMN transferase, partial [Rhizomicrobium sp.]